MHPPNILVGAASILLGGLSVAQAWPTLIETAPDGKRVLDVYEKEIASDSTKKNLLYIDGHDLLTNVHDPAVLVVDDDDVRHSAAGVVLATFDGNDIRRGRGGKVMMNYQHPDLCPTASANRVFRVDGPPLTKQQLVAVLSLLKPEMFKLSPEETAAQQKDMANNAAEADAATAADHVAGSWQVLNGHGPIAKINQGSITFAPKKGVVYPVTFDYTKDGGPTFTGVAVSGPEASGEQPVWTAYGTAKTIGLCVYEIDGGTLTGTWYPWYFDGNPKNMGTEKLAGPATLAGEFKIAAAAAPMTGAGYGGSVTIAPLKIVGASDDEQPYTLTWTMGAMKVRGIGIRTGNRLFVSAGAGADVNIAKLVIHNGSCSGDFFKLGSTEMGSTAAMSP